MADLRRGHWLKCSGKRSPPGEGCSGTSWPLGAAVQGRLTMNLEFLGQKPIPQPMYFVPFQTMAVKCPGIKEGVI